MTKLYCNICGRELNVNEEDEINKIFSFTSYKIEKTYPILRLPEKPLEIDLCNGCDQKFKDLILNKEKRNGRSKT